MTGQDRDPGNLSQLRLHPVQISSLRLHRLSATLMPASEEEPEPTMNVVGSVVECSGVDATCEATLDIMVPPAPEDFDGVKVSVAMRADMVSVSELDPRQWRDFSHLQLVLLLWPYLREIVSDITVRMNLPALVLPTLEVPRQAPPPCPETPSNQEPDREVPAVTDQQTAVEL